MVPVQQLHVRVLAVVVLGAHSRAQPVVPSSSSPRSSVALRPAAAAPRCSPRRQLPVVVRWYVLVARLVVVHPLRPTPQRIFKLAVAPAISGAEQFPPGDSAGDSATRVPAMNPSLKRCNADPATEVIMTSGPEEKRHCTDSTASPPGGHSPSPPTVSGDAVMAAHASENPVIRVEGCDGVPACNGDFLYAGERNERPCFTHSRGSGALYYDGTFWKLCQHGDGVGMSGWNFSQKPMDETGVSGIESLSRRTFS